MIFTATETSTRFYITKGWSANSETPLQEITLDYLTIVEIPNQINYISCTSLNNNLTMLSNSGVNINDSLSVKGYLNAYYNAQFSYLAYQQVISNCATYAGSYVLPRKGTQADFVESGYRFGFNGMEKDDEAKCEGNSYDFGARIYDSRLGRWLSLDPLMKKYPGFSPYNFVSNCPLSIVDPDGRENVIYLVVLPDANSHLKTSTPQQIADAANKTFERVGLNTRVVVVESKGPLPPSFDMGNMDKTDAVAVMGGSKKSTVDYIKKMNPAAAEAFKGWDAETRINPERSIVGGKIIGIDASDILDWSVDQGISFNEAGGLIINHGAGHNAGNSGDHLTLGSLNSSSDEQKRMRKEGVDITSAENNKGYTEKMQEDQNFGSKPHKDNYSSNEKKNKSRLGNILNKKK